MGRDDDSKERSRRLLPRWLRLHRGLEMDRALWAPDKRALLTSTGRAAHGPGGRNRPIDASDCSLCRGVFIAYGNKCIVASSRALA